jgi:hypothetical protein
MYMLLASAWTAGRIPFLLGTHAMSVHGEYDIVAQEICASEMLPKKLIFPETAVVTLIDE